MLGGVYGCLEAWALAPAELHQRLELGGLGVLVAIARIIAAGVRALVAFSPLSFLDLFLNAATATSIASGDNNSPSIQQDQGTGDRWWRFLRQSCQPSPESDVARRTFLVSSAGAVSDRFALGSSSTTAAFTWRELPLYLKTQRAKKTSED